jgi:hypothetical protein
MLVTGAAIISFKTLVAVSTVCSAGDWARAVEPIEMTTANAPATALTG